MTNLQIAAGNLLFKLMSCFGFVSVSGGSEESWALGVGLIYLQNVAFWWPDSGLWKGGGQRRHALMNNSELLVGAKNRRASRRC